MKSFKTILVLLTLCFCLNMSAQKCKLPFPEGKHLINTDEAGKNIAMEGYDILSFFDSAPEKGSTDFMAEYEGIKYLFVSEDHMSAFKAEPKKYLPQFGGFCAVAASFNKVEELQQYDLYEVVDGKLYFNRNEKANKVWKKKKKKTIANANNNWNCLVTEMGLDINEPYKEPEEIK